MRQRDPLTGIFRDWELDGVLTRNERRELKTEMTAQVLRWPLVLVGLLCVTVIPTVVALLLEALFSIPRYRRGPWF
jgi:hypothetical protein